MHTRIFMLTLTLMLASGTLRAQNSPLIGTWKMNLTKSKFEGGAPPTVPQISKYEAAGSDGLKITTDGVNPAGQKTHTESAVKIDGKDYPVTGDKYRDSQSMKQIDAHTWQLSSKKDGVVVRLLRRTVSPDGKTMTSASVGINPNGVFSHDVIVYDKQ
jgi:hypothetical protein